MIYSHIDKLKIKSYFLASDSIFFKFDSQKIFQVFSYQLYWKLITYL